MKKLNLRLLRMIKHTKGQFIAVTALITIGIMVYVALSNAMINLDTTVDYYYEITNLADIYVEVVKIPKTAVEDLKHMDGIAEIQGRIVEDVPLKVSDSEKKVNLRLISMPEEEIINKLYMTTGEKIENDSRDCILLNTFADARGIQVGDKIRPNIIGKEYTYKVAGTAASSEYIYAMENEQSLMPEPDKFGIAFIAEKSLMQNLGFGGSYNQLIIKLNKNANEDIVKKNLEQKLKKYGVKRVYARDELLSYLVVREEIEGGKKTSSTIPYIFLIAAAGIISVMISRIVKNDRTSIGVMKAMGITNFSIVSHYSMYSIITGTIGGFLGVGFGITISAYMAELYKQVFNLPVLKLNIYYEYIVSAIVLSALFCAGSGILGSRKVISIMPAESMRPEAPKYTKNIAMDKISFLWKRLSFSWKVVVRNILRSKKRILLISGGIAVTYAIMLMPINQSQMAFSLFSKQYGEFQTMDYTVAFSKFLDEKNIIELKKLTEVERIEPKLELPFEIANSWKKKTVTIIGIDSNTGFYNFEDSNREPISLPEKGMLINEGLAKILDVKKGDIVKVKNFLPGRDDVHVRIENIIKQSLGINGYMNIDYMREELTGKAVMTGVNIDSKHDVKEDLSDVKYITSVQSLKDLISSFEQFLALTILMISIMTIFSGFLGFAIVYNSTVMSINERKLEFSSLRIMGFDKNEIYKMILRENMIMTIIGIILGIPLGTYIIEMIAETFSTEIYTLDTEPFILGYFITGVLTVGFVVLAQLATLKKIHKLDFIEALKNRIS